MWSLSILSVWTHVSTAAIIAAVIGLGGSKNNNWSGVLQYCKADSLHVQNELPNTHIGNELPLLPGSRRICSSWASKCVNDIYPSPNQNLLWAEVGQSPPDQVKQSSFVSPQGPYNLTALLVKPGMVECRTQSRLTPVLYNWSFMRMCGASMYFPGWNQPRCCHPVTVGSFSRIDFSITVCVNWVVVR